ncbi:hypothetical protein AB6A40_011615 [Gnathostoma spinigerum]|uniref:Secreted protein n=1 Tax=Gnathostoma spinigerum TaxID=75299 RepID=A0ABD6EYA6_9BILA
MISYKAFIVLALTCSSYRKPFDFRSGDSRNPHFNKWISEATPVRSSVLKILLYSQSRRPCDPPEEAAQKLTL